jgi:hypothetical protein
LYAKPAFSENRAHENRSTQLKEIMDAFGKRGNPSRISRCDRRLFAVFPGRGLEATTGSPIIDNRFRRAKRGPDETQMVLQVDCKEKKTALQDVTYYRQGQVQHNV